MRSTSPPVLATLVVALLLATNSVPQGAEAGFRDGICGLLFRPLTQRAAGALPVREVTDLEDLLQGFAHGLEPDPSDSAQIAAFEIYRKLRFGNPATQLNAGTWSELARALKKNPELRKEPFRNYRLELEQRSYPVTAELRRFLQSQSQSTGQVRSNLFQIDFNRGYWKKILQFQGSNEQFLAYFDRVLPPEQRSEIAGTTLPARERATRLYHFLSKERERILALGGNAAPVSQAIADLIHTIGFHDAAIAQDLRSPDGMVRLSAFRRAMDERDSFAMALRQGQHFEQVLRDLHVQMPTGLDSAGGLAAKLNTFEEELVRAAQSLSPSSSPAATLTIRHLSLTESPFRSCLGGSDCSSRTYLTRALDPNYHYFTLTDETGYSSGHITVVLGEAKDPNNQDVKMAFVDKVQNIPHALLPAMMEGVRRSVGEKDYVLALPMDLGDHNGISNVDATRDFIAKSIRTDHARSLTGFKPRAHDYHFPNQYSRAEEGLVSRPVLPIAENGPSSRFRMLEGSVDAAWNTRKVRINQLIQASFALKHGDAGQKIRYLSSMQAVKGAGFKPDPEFRPTFLSWLDDPAQPFELRKQILLHEWLESAMHLPDLLDHFSPKEKQQVLQILADTPRYAKRLLTDRPIVLPDLLAFSRGNRGLRAKLWEMYAEQGRPKVGADALPLLEHLVDRLPEEPGEKAGLSPLARKLVLELLAAANSSDLISWDHNRWVGLLAGVHGTPLEKEWALAIPRLCAAVAPTQYNLGVMLQKFLGFGASELQRQFARNLIAVLREETGPLAGLPAAEAFQRIVGWNKSVPALELLDAFPSAERNALIHGLLDAADFREWRLRVKLHDIAELLSRYGEDRGLRERLWELANDGLPKEQWAKSLPLVHQILDSASAQTIETRSSGRMLTELADVLDSQDLEDWLEIKRSFRKVGLPSELHQTLAGLCVETAPSPAALARKLDRLLKSDRTEEARELAGDVIARARALPGVPGDAPALEALREILSLRHPPQEFDYEAAIEIWMKSVEAKPELKAEILAMNRDRHKQLMGYLKRLPSAQWEPVWAALDRNPRAWFFRGEFDRNSVDPLKQPLTHPRRWATTLYKAIQRKGEFIYPAYPEVIKAAALAGKPVETILERYAALKRAGNFYGSRNALELLKAAIAGELTDEQVMAIHQSFQSSRPYLNSKHIPELVKAVVLSGSSVKEILARYEKLISSSQLTAKDHAPEIIKAAILGRMSDEQAMDLYLRFRRMSGVSSYDEYSELVKVAAASGEDAVRVFKRYQRIHRSSGLYRGEDAVEILKIAVAMHVSDEEARAMYDGIRSVPGGLYSDGNAAELIKATTGDRFLLLDRPSLNDDLKEQY